MYVYIYTHITSRTYISLNPLQPSNTLAEAGPFCGDEQTSWPWDLLGGTPCHHPVVMDDHDVGYLSIETYGDDWGSNFLRNLHS